MAGESEREIEDGVGDDVAAERAGVEGIALLADDERADSEVDVDAAGRVLAEDTMKNFTQFHDSRISVFK